jgi:biotin carboxyl carrier protein
MKMENTICADEDGIIEEIFTKKEANIEAGFTILKIKAN